MGVQILELHPLEQSAQKHFARVLHCGYPLDVVIVGEYQQLAAMLNQHVIVEFELNEVVSVEVGLERDDDRSGLFPHSDGQILVDGTVHNRLELDESLAIYDIAIRNGADFLAINSDELQAMPQLDSRIRIIGKGLHVYPSFL